MKDITLEVCCGGAGDAVTAARCGASRVELNSSLLSGGLTPSAGEFLLAREKTDIPIICMVRQRAGGFCYSPFEFDAMLRDAAFFMEHGAAGIAFGILTEDGRVDKPRCRRLMAEVGQGESVFHRAFDAAAGDPLEMAEKLAELGVTRLLSSGRAADALTGAPLLRQVAERFAGRVQLLPGGGVRESNAAEIVRLTGCTQLHFSCHRTVFDRSGSGNSLLSFDGAAPPAPAAVQELDGKALRARIAAIRGR